MYGTERWRINVLTRTLATRHRTYAAVGLARIGLYPGQETLLLALDRFGPMTQRQLGERLGVEPPTLSVMARKLEARGVIGRTPSPDDSRATIVTLTDKGRDLLPDIQELGRDLAETTLAGMDEETVQAMMRGMLQAIRNLEDRCAAERGEAPRARP
jgi:DNA-binding MarR family transcriptional regulator